MAAFKQFVDRGGKLRFGGCEAEQRLGMARNLVGMAGEAGEDCLRQSIARVVAARPAQVVRGALPQRDRGIEPSRRNLRLGL